MYVLTYTKGALFETIGYLFYATINHYTCKMYTSVYFVLFSNKFINQLFMLKTIHALVNILK